MKLPWKKPAPTPAAPALGPNEVPCTKAQCDALRAAQVPGSWRPEGGGPGLGVMTCPPNLVMLAEAWRVVDQLKRGPGSALMSLAESMLYMATAEMPEADKANDTDTSAPNLARQRQNCQQMLKVWLNELGAWGSQPTSMVLAGVRDEVDASGGPGVQVCFTSGGTPHHMLMVALAITAALAEQSFGDIKEGAELAYHMLAKVGKQNGLEFNRSNLPTRVSEEEATAMDLAHRVRVN